jgi:peptide methionine sulfoxide reductase msrA/msrB
MKRNITITLAIIILGSLGYFWHQDRKSNYDERMVDLAKFDMYTVATFSGGCFWCSESIFEKTNGVVEVVSGYTGGSSENPSYKDVAGGATGHREAVQVFYDPKIVTYAQLLDVFWRHVDPTDATGQFADRGAQYTTAIYYHNDEQKIIAESSKAQLDASEKFDKKIVTPIVAYEKFFVAEDYHQNYYKNNRLRYKYYFDRSGRNDYIIHTWGDTLFAAQNHLSCDIVEGTAACDHGEYSRPSQEAIKKNLTDIQYDVTQNNATETPFDNEYWNLKEDGIYVDIVSGEPLFSSKDQYTSGTGWPSFVKPIDGVYIVKKPDYGLHLPRTEVRSTYADSHLGHVFADGPEDRGGLRYCINSAALRFVPLGDMRQQGYEKYLYLFE